MLKRIPAALSPDLMAAMMKMGHGDEIVFADGHFPADSMSQQVVRADGLGATQLLEAVLQFFPLDRYTEDAAVVMQPVELDAAAGEPPIWEEFRRLLQAAEDRAVTLTLVDRFEFYERAKRAYVIVATSETALYANLILRMGNLPG